MRPRGFYPEIVTPGDDMVFWWPYADGWVDGRVLPGSAGVLVDQAATGVTHELSNGLWRFETTLPVGDTVIELVAQPLTNRTYQTAPKVVTLRFDPSDDDGDGLPNSWEMFYGLDALDDGSGDVDQGAQGDPDSDGFTNAEEFSARSHPTHRVLISDLDAPMPQALLVWSSLPGAVYQVQYNENLLSNAWVDVGAELTAIGWQQTFVDTGIGVPSPRFYRVRIVEEP